MKLLEEANYMAQENFKMKQLINGMKQYYLNPLVIFYAAIQVCYVDNVRLFHFNHMYRQRTQGDGEADRLRHLGYFCTAGTFDSCLVQP